MRKLLPFLIIPFLSFGQQTYVPSDSIAPNILTYTFSGGSFQSYGCINLDPTYWLSGSGNSFTVNFVNSQTNPSFRVWGMNDDDSAEVFVNESTYFLSLTSASYDDKVICDSILGYPNPGSPGPEGVIFSSGLLVGANSNSIGNYSYQNVTINSSNVNSLTVVGESGNGWGFAGITTTIEHPITIKENSTKKNILKITDLLGRDETNNNKGFQLHIYDDGSVEKKYLIK